MLARVMLLTCLASVVGLLRTRDSEKLPFPGGGTVARFLETADEHLCSVIFVTDDSGPLSTIVNDAQQRQRGAAVFETALLDRNTTVTHRLSELVSMARRVRQLSWCTIVVLVSQDPAFLVAFAEWSLRGRLLVWVNKLLVVTRLALPNLKTLLPTYWTFSMMNAVFLNYEEVPNIGYIWYGYRPYSPNGARLERVATWTPKGGLPLHHQILPFFEKFVNFHGAVVNVTALPFMPYWDEEAGTQAPDGTSVTTYKGSDYQLLMAVASALNFTIRVLPSSSWAEVTSQVQERVSFIAPVFYILMPSRAEKYDFTQTYEFSYFSFAMAKPGQEPRWQSLYYPLAQHVWLALMGCALLVPLIYIAINYLGQTSRTDTNVLGTVFQDMTGILVSQSIPHQLPSASSSRVLMVAWIMFALIVGSAYRGNLTASLTLPKYPSRPETLLELVDAVERVTMGSYGESHYKYYKKSKSPLFNALASLMEVGPSLMEGLRGALHYKHAHLGGRRYLKYHVADKFTDVDGTSHLYVGRETLNPGASGWPIPHDAPYKPQLDRWILAIIEAGLYEKWAADFLIETKRKSQRRQRNRQAGQQEGEKDVETDSLTALTIIHMQGAFILLLIGIYIASVSVVGELVASRLSFTWNPRA